MRTLSRLGFALIVSFATTGTIVATAGPATAADCGTAWQDRTSAWDIVKSNEPIRSGPHAGCALKGTGTGRYTFNLDCWTVNTAGNVWWHGRGTDGNGWVFEDNLVYNNNVRNSGNRCQS